MKTCHQSAEAWMVVPSMSSYIQRWKLAPNPADRNELPLLEHAWAWESTHSSRAKKIVRAQDLSVLFLAETWADEARLSKLCDDLNFDEKWVVGRVTRAGGLALRWNNSLNVKIVASSLNYIDSIFNDGQVDA